MRVYIYYTTVLLEWRLFLESRGEIRIFKMVFAQHIIQGCLY